MVALAVLGLMYLPGVWSNHRGHEPSTEPQLPSTIAPYSWYTGMLSADHFDAAVLQYQNGVGVEFMDDPQSVLLSTDGRTYRRLDQAEHATIAEDQGDPAYSVLSPTALSWSSAARAGSARSRSSRCGTDTCEPFPSAAVEPLCHWRSAPMGGPC